MNKQPFISIIVPCYKLAKYIPETIESILNQNYKNWECIIINDGSTDNSEEVCLALKVKDKRINYYYKKNEGSSSSRKRGYDLAKGDYILFLDGDDLIEPDYLIKMAEVMNSSLSPDIAVCNYKVLDDRFNRYKPHQSDMRLDNFNYKTILLEWDRTLAFPTHCCLYRSKLLEGYSFNLNIKSKEDWVMAIHLFKKTKKIAFVDETLAIYRFRVDSKMKSSNYLQNLKYTFNQLMVEEIEEDLKIDFFKNVNDFWIERINEKDRYIKTLLTSSKYKIGNLITMPFHKLYNLLTK